jgi:magnesium transporter
MASVRTTYPDRQRTQGAGPAGHRFVWVSLRDPDPQELAAVQAEFGLPASVVQDLPITAKRPALEVQGELLVAVVKTASWVAAEELVRLGAVQLVLADGFVVSVDRDTAVPSRVRQDLQADPELAGAGPAAVLPSVADHAVEGYGRVLSACVGPWPRSPRCWTAWPARRRRPRVSGSGDASGSNAHTYST